ncbi:MAG TPA: zf-HC2 domain-containing protein [Gemmatimonadaceae bacterium]
MTSRDLTCDDVDAGDLDVRYLAGTLAEAEAEAFEAHYFACERCWTAVSRGLEVRAAGVAERAAGAGSASRIALAPPSVVERRPPVTLSHGRARRPLRWSVLGAAAALLVAVAIWRADDAVAPTAGTLRGLADSLRVVAVVRGGVVHASWAGARDATHYRARLLTGDARLLLERETADTAVAAPLDSLARTAADSIVYWDVHGLDRLRRVTARSGLVPVRLPPRP